MHSLPDVKSRLCLANYDTTDAIIVSDHRPVALASVLNVQAIGGEFGVVGQGRATARSSAVWARCVFSELHVEPLDRGALYDTPYYKAPVEGKAQTSATSSSEKSAKITPDVPAGENDSGQTNGGANPIFRRIRVGDSPKKKMSATTDISNGDKGSSSFMDEVAIVEIIFPIVTEDPLKEARSAAGAAAEGVATGRASSKKKEKSQVFARAGAAAAAGAAAGEGHESAASGTVALKRSEVLSTTCRFPLASFLEGRAAETVSEVTPALGMHALLKFVDGSGDAVAQGALCLAAVARAHMASAHDAEASATGLATGVAKAPLPVEVNVELSRGGRRCGTLVVQVTCEKVTRIL